ncbi:MAG: hypothetical protein ABIR92_10200 [Gemmatimonadaceae bacterium]
MRIQQLVSLPVLVGALSLSACGDSTSPNSRAVSLSFSSQAAAAGANFDVIVVSGANTLVITKAQMVLREIELKQSASAACGNDDAVDDCDEIELGVRLIDLPVTAGLTTALTASIPEGTYREIEFEIHKPSGDAKDAAFKAANPAFADISIRVEGTYNGQQFVFTSAVSQDVELEFNPPVVVTAANNNVTIQVDLSRWFKTSTGALIDPSTANPGQPNVSLVSANIKASLKAVEDDDKDGR